ncbi:MAG: hypothetical protein R3Y43_07000 [Alphaproteobacteria bacterium]
MLLILSACTSLTYQEKSSLRSLKAEGITIDKPVGNFEKPNSGLSAGLLNLLPGGGNFYLGSGNGADSSQITYGAFNLLLWPISVLWGIPQASIDASTINERELVYYYTYDKSGKKALEERGYNLEADGQLFPIK